VFFSEKGELQGPIDPALPSYNHITSL